MDDTSIPVNPDYLNLIQNGKNINLVVCLHCPTKILNPGLGQYTQIEFILPFMKAKLGSDTPNGEKLNDYWLFKLPFMQAKVGSDTSNGEELNDYWLVRDMFTFENIGFSNTVSGLKYLTCADCEMGPIGWHDPASKLSYLALARVKYVEVV